jgi:hypothetical protein
MRRTTTFLTVALGGLLGVTPPATARPDNKAPFKCPPKNEGIVVADAQAIVYKATTIVYEPEEHKFVKGLQEIFGCAREKRAYHFGSPPYGGTEGPGGVGPIVLAGAVVAYDIGESSRFPLPMGREDNEILVRNLRTGKLLHRMPNGSPAEPGDVGLGETAAIVVKNDGSVAWIVRAGRALGSIQVRSADKTGEHLLAASPEIAPESLALAGSTIYWTQGGKPMSATLN